MLIFFLPLLLVSVSFLLYPYFEEILDQKESAYIGSKGISETIILKDDIGLISTFNDKKELKTLKAISYSRIECFKPVLIVKFLKEKNVFVVEEFI